MERVRQIMANLVYNAYHYTPENGTIKVQIQPLNGGHEVQVDVEDNGVGISLEDQERVFQRFYRANTLVLATREQDIFPSLQIVEMHSRI
jgi:signal transduction histidine kinase